MSGRPERTRRPSVRFESSPSSSGSRHHRNDSGVGSLSDYDLHDTDSDRTDRRRTGPSVSSLTLALDRLRAEQDVTIEDLAKALKDVEKWKKKAHDADSMRIDAQKDLNETKATLARTQGLNNRVELLEQENRDLKDENKKLVDAKATLEEKLEKTRKKLDKYRKDDSSSSSQPAIRGGSGSASGTTEKLKRRLSKNYKDADAEVEREKVRSHKNSDSAEKEKEKLRSRFDRSDQSDTSNGNGKSSSGRRRHHEDTYVEPLGEGAPRPQVPIPPSPGAHPYNPYGTAQHQMPQFNTMQPPPPGRSIRPQVTYVHEDARPRASDRPYR